MTRRVPRTIVQIYEIQDPREAETVIGLGVDRIGSVLLSQEDWKVPEIRDAGRVSKAAGREQSIIPLFHDREVFSRILEYYEPELLHFCDALDEEDGSWKGFFDTQVWLKSEYPALKVMRSIPVPPSTPKQATQLLEPATRFETVTDVFLTDTWVDNAPEAGFIGITGRPCDWDMAKDLVEAVSIPVILAGGLSPENVYQAIRFVKPFGVDSCTMTNHRDKEGKIVRFKKDMERVRWFVEEVRRADEDLLDEQVLSKTIR